MNPFSELESKEQISYPTYECTWNIHPLLLTLSWIVSYTEFLVRVIYTERKGKEGGGITPGLCHRGKCLLLHRRVLLTIPKNR